MSTLLNSRINYMYSIDRNSYYSSSTWSNSSFKYFDIDVSMYVDLSAHIVLKEEDKFALIMNELCQLKKVNNRQSRSLPLERDALRGRESRNFDRCSMCKELRHIIKNCSTRNWALNKKILKQDNREFLVLLSNYKISLDSYDQPLLEWVNSYFTQNSNELPLDIALPLRSISLTRNIQFVNLYEVNYSIISHIYAFPQSSKMSMYYLVVPVYL